VKSKRFEVSIPGGIADQVVDLAARMGTSQSKAALWLIIKGLEAIQGTDNPLNKKP
jgi:hypothetical protein